VAAAELPGVPVSVAPVPETVAVPVPFRQ